MKYSGKYKVFKQGVLFGVELEDSKGVWRTLKESSWKCDMDKLFSSPSEAVCKARDVLGIKDVVRSN